jgi:hypothetical protein
VHPFLIRLGILPEVQSFFEPFYSSDGTGNLVFNYGDSVEHYGFAFHRVPDSKHFWVAGNLNFSQVRQVLIGSSAMDCIAFFNFNFTDFRHTNNLLFLSIGVKPNAGQMRWIVDHLKRKAFTLIFGSDLLGRICDLKVAAGISRVPLEISIYNESVVVDFRMNQYHFPQDNFSLNAFEKASGYRFHIRTAKSKNFDSWLSWLKEKTFNS